MMKAVLPAAVISLALAMSACGSGTATTETSAPPSSSALPSPPTTHPTTPPVIEPVATLTSPKDGADVRQCEIFTGTTHLPATKTLVLGMRNLDNHDPNRYFELVEDWEYPTDLKNWRGYQWFGSGNTSVRQRFRIELLIVDVAEVKAALKKSKKTVWFSEDNPASATVAAHITLKRVAGAGPAECS